ncbi:MAG TPA: GNAT family N-acetyltransferase, partial [Methanomicrobiales archaeon]|nr:GNAT family N-acetyltransferase [Methanomicrobiales archaeon]
GAMNRNRTYPDEPAGPFPEPPLSFEDQKGREIEIRPYDPEGDDFETLVDMYNTVDPTDRTRGIPPKRESRIRSWLENVLYDDCLNVVAWNGDAVAGHAVLVPDEEAYELTIFVIQRYRQASIGTHLMRSLLGYGEASDVEQVWLTVDRGNQSAITLYEKMGFETSKIENLELEMVLRLQ